MPTLSQHPQAIFVKTLCLHPAARHLIRAAEALHAARLLRHETDWLCLYADNLFWVLENRPPAYQAQTHALWPIKVFRPDGSLWLTMQTSDDMPDPAAAIAAMQLHRAIRHVRPQTAALLHLHPPALMACAEAPQVSATETVTSFPQLFSRVSPLDWLAQPDGTMPPSWQTALSPEDRTCGLLVEDSGFLMLASSLAQACQASESAETVAERRVLSVKLTLEAL